MLHLIYSTTVIHIYITFISLFLPFFILLPHFWAGWLATVLLVGNNNPNLIILSTSRAVQPNKFIQNDYFWHAETILLYIVNMYFYYMVLVQRNLNRMSFETLELYPSSLKVLLCSWAETKAEWFVQYSRGAAEPKPKPKPSFVLTEQQKTTINSFSSSLDCKIPKSPSSSRILTVTITVVLLFEEQKPTP